MDKYKEKLTHKNPALRRRAVLSLQEVSFSKSFKILCNVLKNDPSPVIRHEAAFILGASKNKKALTPLITAIKKDSSDLVRHEALESLGDLGIRSKEVKNIMQKVMKEKNPFMRDTAQIAFKTLFGKLE